MARWHEKTFTLSVRPIVSLSLLSPSVIFYSSHSPDTLSLLNRLTVEYIRNHSQTVHMDTETGKDRHAHAHRHAHPNLLQHGRWKTHLSHEVHDLDLFHSDPKSANLQHNTCSYLPKQLTSTLLHGRCCRHSINLQALCVPRQCLQKTSLKLN